ncbi:hypothetical protein Pla123a_21200 [Posidoniimonas polymericola]|uniref:Uncharacterized protein n=1 Tax=Posidoniimonas polymericola TaxID=2528002 RepID=A0A5C5YRE7_9BACT|nr:hypothetical protein [Posidoniimonas polymericola]TWT77459.1 hypothetical protein Pla123a_21200 [Posidoniimonas polymericola]
MTAQPLPEKQEQLLIDLEQEWFQPILLPLDSYSDFAKSLSDQLEEFERRFPAPEPLSRWGR